MYNQPTRILANGKHAGALYKNPIDALIKIFKTEGPLGWYKGNTGIRYESWAHNKHLSGSFAHFLRFTPHTYVASGLPNLLQADIFVRIMTLTFNDLLTTFYMRQAKGP